MVHWLQARYITGISREISALLIESECPSKEMKDNQVSL